MADRREYDVTVFGATGFTGQWIAVALARASADAGGAVRVALAGRDAARLRAVEARVRSEVPAFTGDVGVVVADARNEDALLEMARGTRVVIAAAGPFRFCGEGVLRACIAAGTHYVDITGEPEFMERMEMEYDAAAKRAGVLAVSSCGFDSIPAEAGASFGAGLLSAAGYLPTGIDSFVALSGGPAGLAVHYATYESAVHGFGSADELRAIRKRFAAAHPEAAAALPIFGRRLARHGGLFFDARTGAYAFPFLGADASIVRRTQRTGVATGALAARPDPAAGVAAAVPLQYAAYVTLPSKWVAALFLAYGSVFQLLARFSLGRRLLLAFPRLFTHGLFSHEGPTRAQIAGARFAMTFFVQGYSAALAPAVLAAPSTPGAKSGSASAPPPPKPDVHAVVRVSGPEPGYDATSRMVVACALTVLEEAPAMLAGKAAGCGPGVLTPGAAFRGTHLVPRLQAAGIRFEVLQAPAAATAPSGGDAGR